MRASIRAIVSLVAAAAAFGFPTAHAREVVTSAGSTETSVAAGYFYTSTGLARIEVLRQVSASTGATIRKTGPEVTPPVPPNPLPVLTAYVYDYAAGTECISTRALTPVEFAAGAETWAWVDATLTAADGTCVGRVMMDWRGVLNPNRQKDRQVEVYPYQGSTTVTVTKEETNRNDTVATNGSILGMAVAQSYCYDYVWGSCLFRHDRAWTSITVTP